MWGNPWKEGGGLVFAWDSTKVFIERMANFFCDVPIFPDDSQTVDDKTLVKMLYMIANGVGKGRGSISGIRQTPTWHTICFSTGEKALTACTEYGGAKARTVSISGSPFPNAGGEFINKLKAGIRENYGHAGPHFIEALMPIIEDASKLEKIKKSYLEYQRALSDEVKTEKGDRISYYFAVVKVAADLACDILDLDDPEDVDRSIYNVFRRCASDMEGNSDMGKKAIRVLLSWVFANEGYFEEKSMEDRGMQHGIIRHGELVGIFPHKLKEILARENFDYDAVLRSWADRSWIQKEQGHNTVKVCIKGAVGLADDMRRRLVAIPWSVASEFM